MTAVLNSVCWLKGFISVLVFLLVFSAGKVYAQRVTNGSNQTIAHINCDGIIQDASYYPIGHIKNDGTVQDGNYRTVGHIKSDGTIQESSLTELLAMFVMTAQSRMTHTAPSDMLKGFRFNGRHGIFSFANKP